MNDSEKKTCYYCNEEQPAPAIFIYKDSDGVERNICSNCKTLGKHWGD